jgi:hypothetical protein
MATDRIATMATDRIATMATDRIATMATDRIATMATDRVARHHGGGPGCHRGDRPAETDKSGATAEIWPKNADFHVDPDNPRPPSSDCQNRQVAPAHEAPLGCTKASFVRTGPCNFVQVPRPERCVSEIPGRCAIRS